MTLAVLGQALVLLAACAAVAGCVASARAGLTLRRAGEAVAPPAGRMERIGLGSTDVLAAATVAAIGVLLVALATHAYEIDYVAGRTSNDLPLGFRLTSLWAGQEGSLLLWLAVLAVMGAAARRTAARGGAPRAMVAFSNAVVLAIASYFGALVAVVARPFALADTVATNGAGLSPALQNYWMVAHPPALYVGYVGVAIPFALVAGALLARLRDDRWVELTRRWSLVAWLGLTAGLLLGARWAYEEIGWGGYWAWDPVENAALMPWLTLTAFLHSVMVQQRRGMLRYWNVILVTLTFSLSIFGTFLTRSGVLSSVHSFVSDSVGWYFIGFLAVVVAGSLALLYASRDLLRARHTVQSAVSRESVFLFNNLLLVSLALTVLWGVLYPILTAAFSGSRVSLQAPWYDFFAVVFGLPLLALTAVGPWISWQRSTFAAIGRAIAPALAAGLVVGAVGLAAGLASSPAGLAAIGLGSVLVAASAADVVRGARARRAALSPGTASWARATAGALRRNRRRYGGLLAHAGIGLLAIGVAGSSAYDRSVERTLREGQAARVAGYAVTYTGSGRSRGASAMQVRARFSVKRGGRPAGTVQAGKDFHPASGDISNEVGIIPDLRTGEDLFVAVDKLHEDGTVTVRVLVNPAVNVLWLGGLCIMLGGAIAAVPSRTRREPAARPPLIGTTPSGYKHADAVPQVRNRARTAGELLPGMRNTPAGVAGPSRDPADD